MGRRLAICPGCGAAIYEQSRRCQACERADRASNGRVHGCAGCGRRRTAVGDRVSGRWCGEEACRSAGEQVLLAPPGPPDWERINRHMAACGQRYEDVRIRSRIAAVSGRG